MPRPFHFHETCGVKKRKRSGDGAPPFASVAEGISTFATRTPDRFHSRPAKQKWGEIGVIPLGAVSDAVIYQ